MTGIGSSCYNSFRRVNALGGKEFLNIGSAGGLQDFGVFFWIKQLEMKEQATIILSIVSILIQIKL